MLGGDFFQSLDHKLHFLTSSLFPLYRESFLINFSVNTAFGQKSLLLPQIVMVRKSYKGQRRRKEDDHDKTAKRGLPPEGDGRC